MLIRVKSSLDPFLYPQIRESVTPELNRLLLGGEFPSTKRVDKIAIHGHIAGICP